MQLSHQDALESAASTLRVRTQATVYTETFTEQDYLDLFIPEPMREHLEIVGKFFAICADRRYLKVGSDAYVATVHVHNMHAYVPLKAYFLPCAPAELVQRFHNVCERLVFVRDSFNHLDTLLKAFRERKTSLGAAAYLLPGIKTLIGLVKDDITRIAMLDFASKRPGRAPFIEKSLRDRIAPAAAAIAAAQLVPEDINLTWDSYFTIGV